MPMKTPGAPRRPRLRLQRHRPMGLVGETILGTRERADSMETLSGTPPSQVPSKVRRTNSAPASVTSAPEKEPGASKDPASENTSWVAFFANLGEEIDNEDSEDEHYDDLSEGEIAEYEKRLQEDDEIFKKVQKRRPDLCT